MACSYKNGVPFHIGDEERGFDDYSIGIGAILLRYPPQQNKKDSVEIMEKGEVVCRAGEFTTKGTFFSYAWILSTSQS